MARGEQWVGTPAFDDEVHALITAAREARRPVLAAGLGRSYGESGLNFGGALIDCTRLDRLIAFDPVTGILRAEAGLSLSELLRFSVPRGWFLPCTPGTRWVTLGGAVANDVHGKNHHRAGTFGSAVRRLGVVRSDGAAELSETENADLFRATIGGLGLTGFIRWVEVQLAPIRSAWLDTETLAFDNLDGFFSLAAQSTRDFEHTVAWVDCTQSGASLGRGLFTRANWKTDGRLEPHGIARKASIPMDLPGFVMNPWTLRTFNATYFRLGRARNAPRAQHYDTFQYPLDAIGDWNRLYGRSGFYQYQCVVPSGNSSGAMRELLACIAGSGEGSFLAVIKTFGSRPSPGMLSFPREGTTLALDFRNRGALTLQLFARLDAIVNAAGGRLYPAKDGRLPGSLMRRGYPEFERFVGFVDPHFSSTFWQRIRNE